MKKRAMNETIPDTLQAKMILMGKDIRAARIVRKITQADFANRLNVSRATISRLESGDPKIGFGLVANAAWMMGLEDRIFSAFAPENDPVAQREARLSLPQRVSNGRRSHPDAVQSQTVDELDF